MSRQHGQEIEVKFTCDAETLQLVLHSNVLKNAISSGEKLLYATYYDTQDLKLRKAHSVLRIRTANGQNPTLCFKSQSDKATAFKRSEIEVPSPQGTVDFSLFDAPTETLLKRLSNSKPLLAQFDVEVKRQAFVVSHLDAQIEIAVDVGVVKSSKKTVPILELELELKSGEEAALYDLASRLTQEFPLSLSFMTKSERGFRLISKPGQTSIVPLFPELSPPMSMDDVVQLSLSCALHSFTSCWRASASEHSQEAVHQIRIALRKLRTLIAVFSKSFACREFTQLKKQAGTIAKALGQTRSLDVLAESLPKLVEAAKLSKRDANSLRASISSQRIVAAREISGMLHSIAAAQFVLKAQHFLVTKAWNQDEQGKKLKRVQSDPQIFSTQALSKLYGNILKRGRKFKTLSMDELHAVRLSLKAFNYAAINFSELVPKLSDPKDFDVASLRLQQGLGQLNDTVFALHFFENMADAADGLNNVAAGKIAQKLKINQASLEKKLYKRWKAFKTAKPYWN